jgi:hypothetical protein
MVFTLHDGSLLDFIFLQNYLIHSYTWLNFGWDLLIKSSCLEKSSTQFHCVESLLPILCLTSRLKFCSFLGFYMPTLWEVMTMKTTLICNYVSIPTTLQLSFNFVWEICSFFNIKLHDGKLQRYLFEMYFNPLYNFICNRHANWFFVLFVIYLWYVIWRALKSRGETHLRVSQSQVAES